MKNKITTILIASITIILAGIAIFTAIRLYQLRQQSVSPAKPQSQPAAAFECDLDVMLVLDRSGSMTYKETGDTKTKLEYAKEAGVTFVNTMSQIQTNNQIRIGVSTFGSWKGGSSQNSIIPNQILTSNFQDAIKSINAIENNGITHTCIECGIKIANDELKTNAHPESQKVVILLSDGCGNINWDGTQICQDNKGRESILKYVNEGKGSGYKYYTVGYDVPTHEDMCKCSYDETTLKEIASDPDSTYYVKKANAQEWAQTFVNLANKVCSQPTPTPTPTGIFTNSCSLNFNLSEITPTATATTTATATPTPTPTATATGAPNSCGGTCGSNYNCQGELFCYQGYCRNPDCPTDSDCTCSTASTTPTATPTTIAAAPRATPTPEASLPNAGVATPTIFGFGIGIVLLIISLVLAL